MRGTRNNTKEFSIPSIDDWRKKSSVGPPPPDTCNPLDRFGPARMNRPMHPYPRPHFGMRFPPHQIPPRPQQFNMHRVPSPHFQPRDLNRSPGFREPIKNEFSHYPPPKNDSSPKVMVKESLSSPQERQDNCVVAGGADYEEGECSDGEPPPPPPRPVNSQSFPPVKKEIAQPEGISEEGECDSDEEEGEIEEAKKKDVEPAVEEDKPKDNWNEQNTEKPRPTATTTKVVEDKPPSPPPEAPPVPKPEPNSKGIAPEKGPPAIATINNKLENIATRKKPPVPTPLVPAPREPNYRDRDYRERPMDWRPPPEGHFREGRNGFNEERMRFPLPERLDRPRSADNMARGVEYRKPFHHQLPKPNENKREINTAGMRPGDMPSLISLPPMPQLHSSKGKVPDFPPIPSPYGPAAAPRVPNPPPMVPNPPTSWNPPGPVRPPVMHPAIPLFPNREHANRPNEHVDDRHIRDYYDFYHRAWEDYYKSKTGHRRDRSPDRFGPPPGMPAMPMPGMPPMPGIAPMPEQRGRSKESAWLRGLKANKKVLEEVKRKPETMTDEDDSEDEPKVHSRIVMKSPADDQRSHRSRPTPDDQGSHKSHPTPDSSPGETNGLLREHGGPKRLTPERYRGVYERKPILPEDRKGHKKSEEKKRIGDVEWRDPWMRPQTSPKDRKRPLSKSSSSSDSSSGSSSPDLGGSIQALKSYYKKDKARRRRENIEAEKLRRLKHKLSPGDFELLVRKRSRELDLPRNYSKRETRNETESDSDGESASSSSSSIGSLSPGMAGKLADSPTSPPSSPDLRRKKTKLSPGGSINSTKRKKEILLKELQKVEDKLKRKKDDTRKHR